MDPRDDLSAQAWATLREYQEPARYLAPFAGSRPAGPRPAGTPPGTSRRPITRCGPPRPPPAGLGGVTRTPTASARTCSTRATSSCAGAPARP